MTQTNKNAQKLTRSPTNYPKNSQSPIDISACLRQRMFIPEKNDSADLDDQQLTAQLSNSITTDLTNISSQQTQLNSSSSDHQSDQTSRLGDELDTDKSYLSAAYILEHHNQPKLVSRSSSFYSQNLQNHPQQPEIQMNQMIQSIQPLQPLIEHRPSIDTLDSYVESKLLDPNFIEQKKFDSYVESTMLDNSGNSLLNSFPFDTSRLSSSVSFNNTAQTNPYFEQFEQFGLLEQNMINSTSSNQNRCGPTVVLIAHHEDANSHHQSMCQNSQDISLYTNYPDSHQLQSSYPHPPCFD